MTINDSRIDVLPAALAEKIAAGEVIERPASVIKELVENCLDSGATSIDILVEEGGFSRIRVRDNGCGMGPIDLGKCLLRHATSKLRTLDDLYSIATLGFRGEALASISAVARVTISSSATNDGLGYGLAANDSVQGQLQPCQHTRGTTVECCDLFYNVPARKKFMKTARAEAMAIVRLMEQLVIAYPAIHFTLSMDGMPVLDTPQTDSPLLRIAQVAGTEFAQNLIRCEHERDGMTATVYISPPGEAKSRPRFQLLYVNLRRIDSDSVTMSIREAFSRFINVAMKPAWFCFLEIDPDRVDVNVHPTKQRIKFDDEKAIFRLLYGTVYDGVSRKISPVAVRSAAPVEVPEMPSFTLSGSAAAASTPDSGVPRFGEPRPMDSRPADVRPISSSLPVSRTEEEPAEAASEAVQTSLSFFSLISPEDKKGLEESPDSNVRLSEEQLDLIACYQIHRMYILASIKNGILLIDQHAAHERILYEQALEDMQRGRAASQRLLFPVVMEFSTLEKALIVGGRDYFTSLGFDIQDFGGASVAVSATPAAGFIKEFSIEEAVREMVHYLMEEKDTQMLAQPQKRFAAAFACGAAIKFGQVLHQEEMNALLNNLFTCENPYICPHGRPTFTRISLDELSRRFLR
jgi:DNA mismatch repair protein MutL